jgi:transposase
MKRNSRSRMDYATEQAIRLRAGPLFSKGCSQAEVARQLGVSRQTSSRWHHAWKRGGQTALQGTGSTGRPPKLDIEQLRQLESHLIAGARAAGYTTDLWTLGRIADLVQRRFRVRYHRGHIWKLLGQMNWSCQRPEKRAKERNEAAVARWLRNDWPGIKKRPVGVTHC